MAEIFRIEFRYGMRGQEIVDSAMKKAEAERLRPSIYLPPVDFRGHGAGYQMDARPSGRAPEGVEKQMEYPLFFNAMYVIEFSSTTSVPE